jgi:segregation and condensation protein A
VVAIAVTPGTRMHIAPDTRPDRAAHVHLDAFDGPLAALLTLIEQRQLDILEVPLGELAGAFLEALATLPDQHLPHISAFVMVAAQLILIKSRQMLPRAVAPPATTGDEGADPEAELRARLLLYRRYRDAGIRLGARAEAGIWLFRREPAVASAAGRAGARPPKEAPLAASVLVAALEALLRVSPPPPPPPTVMVHTVTLEDRASFIRAALRDAPQVVLQELLADVNDRVVVAVTFMAMLEMVKGRELTVEQSEPWGPIHCRRRRPSDGLVAIPVRPAGVAGRIEA